MIHVVFALFLITTLFSTHKQLHYTKLRKAVQGDYELWEVYYDRETKYRLIGMATAMVTGFMGAQLYL